MAGVDDLYWALTDNLNSIRDLAEYTSGQTPVTTVESHRVFDAYGNKTSEIKPCTGDPAAVDCVFNYTGKLFDAKTGLQNNLNRWYDASTGKWISEDPIRYEGDDCNLYRYANSSPTANTDPYGFKSTSALIGTLESLPIPCGSLSIALGNIVVTDFKVTGGKSPGVLKDPGKIVLAVVQGKIARAAKYTRRMI